MAGRSVSSTLFTGRPTTAFEQLFCAFLIYYFLANLSEIRNRGAVIDQAVASIAQVAVPFGVAAGFMIALSPRATGLAGPLSRSMDGYGRFYAAWSYRYALVTASLMILVYVLWAIAGSTFPTNLRDVGYLLLAPAYGLAGCGLGVLAGTLFGALWRPVNSGLCYVLSTLLGIVTFCAVIVLAGRLPDSSPANLTLSSEVTPAGVSIATSLLYFQILAAALVGVSGIGLVWLLGSRRKASAFAGVAGVTLGLMGLSTLAAVGAPHTLYEVQTDTRCVDGSPIVCSYPSERSGALLLQRAVANLQSVAPTSALPTRIEETRQLDYPAGSRIVKVGRMPSNQHEAATFAVESLFKAAGCEAADVASSKPLARLLQDVKAWLQEDGGDGASTAAADLRSRLRSLEDAC